MARRASGPGRTFGDVKMPVALCALAFLLAACTGTGRMAPSAAVDISLPPMKIPQGIRAAAPMRSNRSIATDFLDLAFQLESGRPLPVISRFETPVTVKLTGINPGMAAQKDLDRLLGRLRAEASIRISQVPPDHAANITVEFLPQRVMRRAVPQAACFVSPGISSWREFLRRDGRTGGGWADLTERRKMAIFVPGDVSPQEVRDCLHEEIAQALGPVNDLYRLTDSVFNDDNFHTVLTGFDMVVLRAYYDRSLRSGINRDAVAARLPAILARVNPAGEHALTPPRPAPTTRAWITEIETALGNRTSSTGKRAAARRAVAIARAQGWNDNRLGFSLYAYGRLVLASDTRAALAAFAEAEALFRAHPDMQLHAAHVAVQSAAFALSSARPDVAIQIADKNSPIALRAENASLLSTLLFIKAQALDAQNRHDQAAIVRLDALGWARYGLGKESDIKKRLNEIASLSPRKQRSNNP